MKVIFGHGLGKLHFFSACGFIKKTGIHIQLISGWRPNNLPPAFVNFLGKIAGRDNLYKRLSIRANETLSKEDVIENAFPEFMYHFLLLLSKFKLINPKKANILSWKYIGRSYKKYLQNADIFHVRSGAGQGGAIATAKKNGLIVVVDQSIAHPKEIENNLKDEYKYFNLEQPITADDEFWKLILKDCEEADYLLVNSDYVKESFIKNGYNPSKIKPIYWGVRSDFFYLKKNYFLSTKPKILFTGGFNLRKGVRTIVSAANLMFQQNIAVEIHIVGDYTGEGEIALCDLVNKESIILHGHVLHDQLKSHLETADMYLFPSFAEGCAQSAMEAMAAGLPIITTTNSGLPITHDSNGIIISPNNPHKIVAAVIELINNEEKRKFLGQNAADLISNNYSWEKYGENMHNLYHSISKS